MARVKRLKVFGEPAYYHIISRTVGKEFYLGDLEKEMIKGTGNLFYFYVEKMFI